MGKKAGGGEDERGGNRLNTQGEGASNGMAGYVRGTHDRLWNRGRTSLMELHLERVPKVRAERG
eukprot:3940008-Pleurochrysis_carterae.AAC.1